MKTKNVTGIPIIIIIIVQALAFHSDTEYFYLRLQMMLAVSREVDTQECMQVYFQFIRLRAHANMLT